MRRRHHRRHRVRRHKATRHRKYHFRGNPVRSHRKRRYSRNPRRRYHRNPAGMSAKGLLPIVISAGAGAVSMDLVPGLVGRFVPMLNSGVMRYVTQAGTGFVGYKLVKRFAGGPAALGFVAGAAAKVIYDLAAGPILALMSPAPATTTSGYGAMIDNYGAYLDTGMGDLGDMAGGNPYGEGIF